MQINNVKNQQISYRGCNHVLASRVSAGADSITCMSVELNNILGNDLEKWQSIQAKLWKEIKPSSTVTLNLQKFGNITNFAVNDRFFRVGNLVDNFNKSEEKPVMELYTWLADFTKRMLRGEMYNSGQGLFPKNFVVDTVNNMRKQDITDEGICELVNRSQFDKSIKKEQIAEIFSDSIQDTMRIYFSD